MIKGLAFIFILGLLVALVILAVVASHVYRIVQYVKKMFSGEASNADNFDKEMRRERRHYANKGGGSQGRTTRQAQTSERTWQNENPRTDAQDEWIVDVRNAETKERKIFSAEDGEYVDFVEEKG